MENSIWPKKVGRLANTGGIEFPLGRFVGNYGFFSVKNVLSEGAVNQFSRILGAEQMVCEKPRSLRTLSRKVPRVSDRHLFG